MHGICFDYPLQDWFEFKVPRTKVPQDYIYNVLHEDEGFGTKPTAKIVWMGSSPVISYFTKNKKGHTWQMAALEFHDKKESFTIQTGAGEGNWLAGFLQSASAENKPVTFAQAKQSYEDAGLDEFEPFWYSKPINMLREYGLLLL